MGGLELGGKRVIVTGAAGGLGRAFAEGFAAAGASVVVADIDIAGAEETARLIAAKGGRALPGLRPPGAIPHSACRLV